MALIPVCLCGFPVLDSSCPRPMTKRYRRQTKPTIPQNGVFTLKDHIFIAVPPRAEPVLPRAGATSNRTGAGAAPNRTGVASNRTKTDTNQNHTLDNQTNKLNQIIQETVKKEVGLAVKQAIREELTQAIPNRTIPPPITYATISARQQSQTINSTSTIQTAPPKRHNPAIIIEHKNVNQHTRENTLKALRTAINFREAKYVPLSIKPLNYPSIKLSKGKTRIEFESAEQQTDAINRINRNNNLGITAQKEKKINPLVIIKGKDIPREKIVDYIIEQNKS
ncbi:hypothetical protein ACJJTC_011665 [Scirpophaga incertulas]